jgi:alanine dehydrogenase
MIRYLADADIAACMPSLARQIELAAEVLRLAGSDDVELPPKLGVHPRPGSIIQAMPAFLRHRDIVGVKWISTYPRNSKLQLPTIDSLIALNDAATGAITDVLDGNRITAARTAAVSAVAMRLMQPAQVRRVTIVGAGVQGTSHAQVVSWLFPEASIQIYDRHPERAANLVQRTAATGHRGHVAASASMQEAIANADVLVTTTARAPGAQGMPTDWVPPEALVVTVDEDALASAELASAAVEFVVDDLVRYQQYRAEGAFPGYPDDAVTLGAFDAAPYGIERKAGRALFFSLGFGLADIVFAAEVRREADRLGVGTKLS